MQARKFTSPTVSFVNIAVLSQKSLTNLTRSGDSIDYVNIILDISTPAHKLYEIETRMVAFVTQNHRNYHPICKMNITDLGDQNFGLLKCQFSINYKGNWRDFDRMSEARTKFFCELKTCTEDLGIVFETPVQRFKN